MAKTSTPPEAKQYWLRLQYDPDQDHFTVEGSLSYTRPEINIDGYETAKKLNLFVEAFMHEVELHRRAARKIQNNVS